MFEEKNEDNVNILYFDNDDDFATYCINPEIQCTSEIDADGNTVYYTDFDFSDLYKNAITNGTRFCIKDLSSHVNKDGLLGYRGCTKQIENIERYYGED